MKDKNAPSLKDPAMLFLSFFGIGLIPKAPGTFGTLATLPFLYLLSLFKIPFILLLPFVFILTILASFIAESIQKKYNIHDPCWIVIDEVIGMIVAWFFIQKHHFTHLALLFILFRIFDIAKVWPASYFDKKMSHGAGTILDDVISGIFAGLSYLAILYFFKI